MKVLYSNFSWKLSLVSFHSAGSTFTAWYFLYPDAFSLKANISSEMTQLTTLSLRKPKYVWSGEKVSRDLNSFFVTICSYRRRFLSLTRLKNIQYVIISFSFAIIWLDWVLLLKDFGLAENETCDNSKVTIFGAGSLFGYVPLLTGVATLKKHGARRGLLLATAISSVILAVYDFSEAIAIFECNTTMGIIFAVQVGA